MTARRLVAIGASSGGIESLRRVVAGLEPEFPAAICVVVHTGLDSPAVIDTILNRVSPVRAVTAESGMFLAAGRIYTAPPGLHLVVEPGRLRLTPGPKEHRFRPAIDPLFRSAAAVYGPAAIGVILSGNLDDGVAGLAAIKRLGGLAVVQDPDDALFPSMPRNALRHVGADYSVPAAELPALLTRLVSTPVQQIATNTTPSILETEMEIAKGDQNAIDVGVEEIGDPSPFACPECHGVLLRLKDQYPLRFRCHTGHAYSAESLTAATMDEIEESLWTAIRALEEGGTLLHHLATHEDPPSSAARRLRERAAETRRQAEQIRELLMEREASVTVRR